MVKSGSEIYLCERDLQCERDENRAADERETSPGEERESLRNPN